MIEKKKCYIAIDLKSYYASVECVSRRLDPLKTNLVVADESRTEKTICLAVSPSLKAYGISGRARLFEVVEAVKRVNAERLKHAPRHRFATASFNADALAADPSLKLTYLIAPPRMEKYMEISSSIYNVYLRYIAPEDIHVYSIDECFIDATTYLSLHHMTAREFCMTLIREVLYATGITATGGIGTNMFLAKVAMDIMAKHVEPDKDGVRIAELDERTFRKELWAHEPITDFWRVGKGYAEKLASNHIYTMGDVARVSIGLPPITSSDHNRYTFNADGRCTRPDYYYNEALLYKLFGVNAELLIDHAWGHEPTTIKQIKSYKPESNSISSGQVLTEPYSFEKAKIIVREMTDLLVLDLVKKRLLTDQIVLNVGYDIDNKNHKGQWVKDHYGRSVPKPVHGSINLGKHSSSTELITQKTMELFERTTDHSLQIRRITIGANHVLSEDDVNEEDSFDQLDLFTDYEQVLLEREKTKNREAREKRLQKAILCVHGKYGKNALLKGTSFMEGATTRERNEQVGGHKK